MKNSIWIVPIEPIDQRYTKQWYDSIPSNVAAKTSTWNVKQIEVEQITEKTTAGAFLNFASTNVYKSRQIEYIVNQFETGKILSGDRFLITDAWNFLIIPLKYMSDLMGIPVEIHSIWHAGAYDPSDILGLKMEKPWPYEFEKTIFHASNFNYFGTEFHRNMFLKNLKLTNTEKTFVSGQPHSLIVEGIGAVTHQDKKNVVFFPHRLNIDKQPDIAMDLARYLTVFVSQHNKLEKHQYYEKMKESKVTFSCSLHENLGISQMEGVLCGSIPIVPDRACYSEMYLDVFKYPSKWTESFDLYMKHKNKLKSFIQEKITNYAKYDVLLKEQKDILLHKYLNADIMIENLVR